MRVPIVDDIVAEQRKNLKFRITAIDEDLIWVDEAQAEKQIYIEDNDGQLKDMSDLLIKCSPPLPLIKYTHKRNKHVYSFGVLYGYRAVNFLWSRIIIGMLQKGRKQDRDDLVQDMQVIGKTSIAGFCCRRLFVVVYKLL